MELILTIVNKSYGVRNIKIINNIILKERKLLPGLFGTNNIIVDRPNIKIKAISRTHLEIVKGENCLQK